MCGAYTVINNPFVNTMTEMLGVGQVETRNIRVPASTVQIINTVHGERQLVDAKWWLMLNPDGKPNYKYSTFNSRYDKLFSSNLTKGLYAKSRCIFPATGIIEGQDKKYHYIEPKTGALALGGICKHYKIGEDWITTASIITCPGNPKLENIHKKSIPLMLDYHDSELINAWLDSGIPGDAFSDLLTNKITIDLIATPIVGARKLEPRGEQILLTAD